MKKNTFLYIVIAVLVIALAGLGALNVRSLDKLASLQTKVNKLQKSVQEVSDSAAELSSKADQLDALYPDDPTVSSAAAAASSAEVQGPSAQEESTDTSAASDSSEASGSKDSSSSTQEEGTLSPSSGSTFTDNSDSSMDNLLNQVQSLLPTDNGTWSVYVCNLAKNTEGTINDQQMQAASLIKLYIMGAVYEDYDSLSSKYSKDQLDNALNSMITVSDNDAANTLVNYLGGGDDAAGMARVNKFCQDHGYTIAGCPSGRSRPALATRAGNFRSNGFVPLAGAAPPRAPGLLARYAGSGRRAGTRHPRRPQRAHLGRLRRGRHHRCHAHPANAPLP